MAMMTVSTRGTIRTMAVTMPGEDDGLLESACSEGAWVGRVLFLMVLSEGFVPGSVGSIAPPLSVLLFEVLLEEEGEGEGEGDGPEGLEGTVALAASAVVVVSDVVVVVVPVVVVVDVDVVDVVVVVLEVEVVTVVFIVVKVLVVTVINVVVGILQQVNE